MPGRAMRADTVVFAGSIGSVRQSLGDSETDSALLPGGRVLAQAWASRIAALSASEKPKR